MSDTASFSQVTRTQKPLYGPRRVLVCGFTAEGQAFLDEVVSAAGISDLDVIYARSSDLETALQDILAQSAASGRGEPSQMPAAIIMAGITENELHLLMSSYRKAGLPNPLWATLTPSSEGWTLRQLLKELSAERAALEKMRPANGKKD